MALITLTKNIRINQTFKNISESSFSKIIFVDKKRITTSG